MPKSIKPEEGYYWDSSGITHNKRFLKEMIESSNAGTSINIPIILREDNCDLNELTKKGTGFFIAWASCNNAPANNGSGTVHWYVIQIVYNSELYAVQIATCLHSDARLYVRHLVGGGWSNWKSLQYSDN